MVLAKSMGNRPYLRELNIPRASSKPDLCSCPETNINNVVPIIARKSKSSLSTKKLDQEICTFRVLACFSIWKYTSVTIRLVATVFVAILLLSAIQTEERDALGNKLEQQTWQLALFRLLPARLLSRAWGVFCHLELPRWLLQPMLRLYVWKFNCNMTEAVIEDLGNYSSLGQLFTRELKQGAREIAKSQLVSPTDGKVLYFGRVQNGMLEQVKGVTYKLQKFLGPDESLYPYLEQANSNTSSQIYTLNASQKELYHVIIYLGPGDYHHFHSPADWSTTKRRHFPGDLLSVAPWAARTMPGLFVLNERAVLFGNWEHGLFSMTAVGAYNVGSINLAVDETLQTNRNEKYQQGEYRDKTLNGDSDGIRLEKGERVGGFTLGSTVVLIFEAPLNFQFSVIPGQTVKYGQNLGSTL